MYSEFVITMTIPAVGLLLIFIFYRLWLWRIQMSATTADGSLDAEKGALRGDTAVGLEDTSAMAARGARDLCDWLAIGWLFMVEHTPSKLRIIGSGCVHSVLLAGLHDPLPHYLPVVRLH